MNDDIDISGLDKARVLMVLYDNARPQGMGLIQYRPGGMTYEQAQELLKQRQKFDYLAGRVLKVDLSGDAVDPYLYDRDNGAGMARRLIESLRVQS